MHSYLRPLARILIGLLFIFSGFSKIVAFSAVSGMMGAAGFPAPGILLVVAIIIELAGGIMLAVGYRVREASIVLALFLVPTTLVFHVAAIDGTQQGQMEIVATLKNLAIIGGLLHLIAGGARVAEQGMERESSASHAV